MAKSSETVEPGIYRRLDPRTGKVLPKLWIHYPGPNGKTVREPTGGTGIVAARKLRAKRLEEHGRGEPGRAGEKVRVGELLDALLTNYEINGRGSLPTLRSHLKVLHPALGTLRVIDCSPDVIERLQQTWQRAGTSNATINRRCNMLRRAFNLGRRARKVHVVPYVPRLEERGARGRYIPAADAVKIAAELPIVLRDFFTFAYEHGTRKGQLARTLRRYVDLERGVITWPPEECKHKEAHTIPLEGQGLAIVAALMGKPRLHCPYLFHGPRCAPGRKPSQAYGCVGDFKKAWQSACKRAKVPAGRRAGGYTFHGTRHSAATNLRAGGLEEADAMRVTGHQTAHVFRHYDIGNVDALRARLTRARGTVSSLRDSREQRESG